MTTGRLPTHLRPPPVVVYRSFQIMGLSPQGGRRDVPARIGFWRSGDVMDDRVTERTRAASRVPQPVRGLPPDQEPPRSGLRPTTARVRKMIPQPPWIPAIQ